MRAAKQSAHAPSLVTMVNTKDTVALLVWGSFAKSAVAPLHG